MKNKFLSAACIVAMLGCNNDINIFKEKDKDNSGQAAALYFLITRTPPTSPNCTNPVDNQVTFEGTIKDGGADGNDSSGNLLGLVEIQTTPTISNVTVTDKSGKFSTSTGICPNVKYKFTAVKAGYTNRIVEAIATPPTTTVTFLLQRDTSAYVFPTVQVKDNSGNLLGITKNTVIGYAAGGATIEFTTNSSGLASPAFPKNTVNVAVSAKSDGMRDCSFIFNTSTSATSSATNCTLNSVGGIIQITMSP